MSTSSTASAPAAPRRRLLVYFGIALVAIDFLTRVIFLAGLDPIPEWSRQARILAWGMLSDAPVVLLQLLPWAWFLTLSGGTSLNRSWWRYTLLTLLCSSLVFGAAVEYSFWAEFNSRFNHIAIDYLLFPGEVATNIWQSYNVPAWAGVAVALGALLAWPMHRALDGMHFAQLTWSRRLIGFVSTTALAGVAATVAILVPATPTGERIHDEVAANGQAQLVRAFFTAHLAYEQFYPTHPAAQATALADAEFSRPRSNDPQRDFTAVMRRDRPLDIVVVLEESLGSEFVGRLGGPRPNTPGFDRWSERGTLLTNLIANGNRTVRGLEGVLCSFLPLPGDSVWKRDKSENVATIAQVLGQHGYRREFFYGGAGIFDGMKPFALANGWESFIEDGVIRSDFPPDAFRTAWGAADSYVFNSLLSHQQAARDDGVPFFGTLLTTSNHKPFLTPDTQHPILTPGRAWRMGLIAVGILIAVILTLVFAGRHWGYLRIIIFGGVLLGGYGILMWVKLQPSDTRENAVRYADKALTAYLDHAAAAGLLDRTVLLVVGDHGARVYGAAEIPAASYRIPALLLAPETRFQGSTIDTLASQIDLAPTLLSIAGIDYKAPFLGRDLLADNQAPGRAWLIHNRDIGLLTDTDLVVLGLHKSITWYQRPDRTSDAFSPVAPADVTPAQHALAERAIAGFQDASHLYEQRLYRLPAAHLRPTPLGTP
jgi:phosphoglycerol transferase MdoB-like AlkP superfamily enzyme